MFLLQYILFIKYIHQNLQIFLSNNINNNNKIMFNMYVNKNKDLLNNRQKNRDSNQSISNSSQKLVDRSHQSHSQVINKINDSNSQIMKSNSIDKQNSESFRILNNNTSKQNFNEQMNIDQKMYIQQLQQKIEQLENQMNELHETYSYKLEQQSQKVNQKNQFFLNLIQQIHSTHNEQLAHYKNMISMFEEQKKQITNIQNKMNHIGSGIQDILRESSELSKTNQELQAKILQKSNQIQNYTKQIQHYKQTIQNYQLMIDEYQKLKLKANKYNRDIIDIIEQTEKQILNVSKKQIFPNDICPNTNLKRKFCQHCKLSNLSDKYQKMIDQSQY